MYTYFIKVGLLFLITFTSMNCLASSETLWLEIKENINHVKQSKLSEEAFVLWFQRRIHPRSKIFLFDSNPLSVTFFDLATEHLKRDFVNAVEDLKFSEQEGFFIDEIRANIQRARNGDFVYLLHVCTLELISPPIGECGGYYHGQLEGVLFLFKTEEIYYQTDNPSFGMLGQSGYLYNGQHVQEDKNDNEASCINVGLQN